MASIDAGKKLGLSDPAIDAYASALDDLETRCGDDRRFLGDMATKAVEILERDAGVSYSTFEVLEGLYLAVGPDEFLESCSDRLAAWLTLVVEGS